VGTLSVPDGVLVARGACRIDCWHVFIVGLISQRIFVALVVDYVVGGGEVSHMHWRRVL